MTPIIVSGHTNIKTTLKFSEFPIRYTPVEYNFFGIHATVSGVGFYIASALTRLGAEVIFLSIIGQDLAGHLVRDTLRENGIGDRHVISALDQTAQSINLYNPAGTRQIHVDLKDIQQQVYPPARMEQAMEACDLLVLCNINYSRPQLGIGRQAGKKIATHVHTVSDLDDSHNLDFMKAADILFMSDERLPTSPETWADEVMAQFAPEILVIGLGAAGALLRVRADGFTGRLPAMQTRPVVNTIGAGDALFSAYLHSYHQTGDPYQALKKAMVFASYKIGTVGAAQGVMDHQKLEDRFAEIRGWPRP